MITSVNSNNSLEYRGLFEEATKDLKEYAKNLLANINEGENQALLLLFINRFPMEIKFTEETIGNLTEEEIENIIKISTLNDYFCNIVELTGINPQYVVLPLDEEVFEINANSRAITVPPSFKKNGVGVQGDHTAETVHFVIDRYFDSIDLAAEDIFIAIQYEGPNKDIHGLDPAVFKDVTTLQNKIIFGWIIDDKVTSVPGNIKFAVHFFKGNLDEATGRISEVKYSFNTLSAQIAINKAFEFDLSSFDTQRDPSQLVIDRLTNSKADGAVDAMAPIFVVNLPEGKVDLNTLDRIDTDATTYTFDALAHSPDAGYIEYTWYRKDGDIIEEVPAEKVSMRYILTEDTTPATNKIYYYKDIDNEWVRLTSKDTFQVGVEYFERRSCCVADYVGTYYVSVKNNVGTSSVSVESNRVEIPRPTMPKENTIEIPEYDILEKCGWDMTVGYYRATKELEDSEVILSISAEPNEGDNIQYKWYKVEGVDEHNKLIPNLTEEGINLIEIEGANEEDYIVNDTGWYTVGIVGARNNATVEFPSERYYRVTSMPETPVFIEVEGIVEEDVYLPLGEYVEVSLDNLDYSDEILYCWYKDVEPYGAEEDANDELLENFENKTKITNEELKNYIGDVLYCKAINIYNKVEAVGKASCRFFIMNSQTDKPEEVQE